MCIELKQAFLQVYMISSPTLKEVNSFKQS